jgi:hypothetical protein
MKRDDLAFLAGMQYPHPDLLETKTPSGEPLSPDEIERPRGQLTKLQGNVARATIELQRRKVVRTALLSAAVGAFFGAGLAAILAR